LLPDLNGSPGSGFINIKTARKVDRSCLVFLGREVTPEMLLERFCENNPEPSNRSEALRRLSAFIEGLQQIRLGSSPWCASLQFGSLRCCPFLW
jgi:hypothetical protein